MVAHVILVSPQVLRLGFGLVDFGLGLDNLLEKYFIKHYFEFHAVYTLICWMLMFQFEILIRD